MAGKSPAFRSGRLRAWVWSERGRAGEGRSVSPAASAGPGPGGGERASPSGPLPLRLDRRDSLPLSQRCSVPPRGLPPVPSVGAAPCRPPGSPPPPRHLWLGPRDPVPPPVFIRRCPAAGTGRRGGNFKLVVRLSPRVEFRVSAGPALIKSVSAWHNFDYKTPFSSSGFGWGEKYYPLEL